MRYRIFFLKFIFLLPKRKKEKKKKNSIHKDHWIKNFYGQYTPIYIISKKRERYIYSAKKNSISIRKKWGEREKIIILKILIILMGCAHSHSHTHTHITNTDDSSKILLFYRILHIRWLSINIHIHLFTTRKKYESIRIWWSPSQ